MCEQCVAETENWGEVIPGWGLCRAMRPGDEMKLGDWGLVWCNDPSYIWTITPRPDIEADYENRLKCLTDLSEKEIDSVMNNRLEADKGWLDRWHAWEAEAEQFGESISKAYPTTAYRLVNGCMGAGFDIDKDGLLTYWLFNHIAMWIKHFTPLSHHDHGTPIVPDDPYEETTFDHTTYNAWEKQFSHVPWFVPTTAPEGTKALDYDKKKIYTTIFPNPA